MPISMMLYFADSKDNLTPKKNVWQELISMFALEGKKCEEEQEILYRYNKI